MNLDITGLHMELTDAIKQHVHDKFKRVIRHCKDVSNAHVICKVEKHEHHAEATLHIPGSEIFAHTTSDDLYHAIDMLIDKLIKQIDKYRAKHSDH